MTTPAAQPEDAVDAMRAGITINGHVHMASGGTIGIANGSSGADTHRLEGVVPEAVIKNATTCYARPDGYAGALKELLDHNVVVLHGGKETGKRTGALNLAEELGPGRPAVMLLPDQSPADLAAREYAADTCYLVIGWSVEESDGSDVGVTALLSKIRKHPTTHLIITSEHRISALVTHITWDPPAPAALLSAHGVTAPPEISADLLDHSLPDLVKFATDLAAGVDAQTSLGTLGRAHQRRVARWFDSEHDPREVLEAAALVFLHGVGENLFERAFEALARAAIPAPAGEEGPVTPSPFVQSRRRGPDSLVETVRSAADGQDAIPGQLRRYVQLKSPGLHGPLVAELCDRFPAEFWTPVFDWIDDLVQMPDPDLVTRVTYGLAVLAEQDFDTVRARFLQPWSSGAHGVRAWQAASQVLSFLCWNGEGGASLARRTAIRWSRSDDVLRRHAAASAFCGLVGLLFPGDAMRHLWFLADRPETSDAAAAAVVVLAGWLTKAGSEAHRVVLKSLNFRLDWARKKDLVRYGKAADIGVSLLRQRLDDQPLAVAHLKEHPDDAALVGELCARIVINRPRRTAVFTALRDLLSPLGDRGPVLTALRDQLDDQEKRLLATQFAPYAEAGGFLEDFLSIFDPEQS